VRSDEARRALYRILRREVVGEGAAELLSRFA
jgi:hypothetical protein